MANSKKRIFYFDALRTLAILSVIMIHVFNSTTYMVQADYALMPSLNWWLSCFLGSAFRTGVCIFLMLSGALSLGRVWDIKTFLGKRIPRIVEPFLFWGFILSILMILISYLHPNFLTTIPSFTIANSIIYIYNSYMAVNPGFTQFWFFWMILGTYLIMPVFNKWLLHSDLKEAEYFLVLWLITCIFDFTLNIECPVKLTYFSGPIGLVVLGYYLRHTKRKAFNNVYLGLAIFLIGFIANVAICYFNSNTHHLFRIDRYAISNIIQVIGIFLTFKNFSQLNLHPDFLYNPDGIFRKSVFSLAKYSYGIYLIHRVFMIIISKYFKHSVNFPELVLIMFIGTLIVSWGVMALLNRVPYVKKVIGAK